MHAEASSEASHKSYCDEETSEATEKEDLDACVAKNSSEQEAPVARSTILDGEISALQLELGVLSNRRLQMDILCAVERHNFAKVKADLEHVFRERIWHLHYSMNSIDRVQQRLVEQTCETLVIPFVEKIVEMLVNQTCERNLQATNTHVQHVVNTAEVETPRIIKVAVR